MNRRAWLSGLMASAGALVAAGCDRFAGHPPTLKMLRVAEKWSQGAQRSMIGRHALAREFEPKDISSDFRANGSVDPQDAEYLALAAGGFAGFSLVVDGLVERPLALSLEQLRAMPSREQITRHDCVEGWSSIGKWTGARLSAVLEAAGLRPEARYVMCYCMDTLYGLPYYESIDLIDAMHEQTILAYDMNDGPLPVKHGAPLRLRVERQLGYKHAKYVNRIEVVASFDEIGGGKGGYWEDQGYEWYAGI